MEREKSPTEYTTRAFQVIFGLGLILALVIFSPLGGWLKDVSAGLQISTVSFLKQGTGTELTLDDGLVGHWTFDGGYMDLSSSTAEVLDRSSYGHNGNWLDHATTTAIGKIGQAIEFDGINDSITASTSVDDTLLNGWTASAWIYPRAVSGVFAVMSNVDGVNTDDGSDFIRLQDGEIRTLVFQNAGTNYRGRETNGNEIQANQWYHVVTTWDGSTVSAGLKIYIDGVQTDDIDVQAGSFSALEESPDPFRIGVNEFNAGLGRYFDGLMDDVRIYNRTLSADEVEKLYQLGTPNTISDTVTPDPLETGLVGHWTFDGGDMDWGSATAEVQDRSEQSNNGDATSTMSTSRSSTQGIVGQAMKFDGVSDRISLGLPGSLNLSGEMSIVGWIKPNDFTTTQGIVSNNNFGAPSGRYLFTFGATDNTFDFYQDASVGSQMTSSHSINDSNWHFFAAVRTGSSGNWTVTFYVDDQVSSDTTTTNPGPYEGGVFIGKLSESFEGNFLNGSLDDVRIYNRALSVDEVGRLHRQGQPAKAASTFSSGSLENGLVGHWTFDGADVDWGNSSAEILDTSGNNQHGNAAASMSSNVSAIPGSIGQGMQNTDISITDNDLFSFTDGSSNDKPFSVSYWLAPNETRVDVKKYSGVDQEWTVYVFSQQSRVLLRDSAQVWSMSSNSVSTELLATGSWRHVVITYDGSEDSGGIKHFVNGIEIVSGVTSDDAGYVGMSNLNATVDISGSTDDVRVYDRVLAVDEIQRLYNMGR